MTVYRKLNIHGSFKFKILLKLVFGQIGNKLFLSYPHVLPGIINKYLQAKKTISDSLAFTSRAVSCNMSETKQFVETLNGLVNTENLYRTSSFQLCLLCHMAANSAIILRKLGVSKDIFANLATFICIALNGYSANFCNDIVRLNIVSSMH